MNTHATTTNLQAMPRDPAAAWPFVGVAHVAESVAQGQAALTSAQTVVEPVAQQAQPVVQAVAANIPADPHAAWPFVPRAVPLQVVPEVPVQTWPQRALVVGLGHSGLAMAQWLHRCQAQLVVLDTRTQPPQQAALAEQVPGAVTQFGTQFDAAALLQDVQMLALSPGLSPTHGPIAPLVALAQERGIEVVSEIDLFVRALRSLRAERGYVPKLVGITGTNGKTTVTRLVTLLAQKAGHTAIAAGNISPAALQALLQALQEDTLPQVWVLELSSFQLQTTQELPLAASTVLNLTQDHLDWHGNMEQYAQAKASIYREVSKAIFNRDDVAVKAMQAQFARAKDAVSFGEQAPQVAGDFGLLNDGSMTWLVEAVADSDYEPPRLKKGQLPPPHPFTVNRLMPMDALRIAGKHNALNALAALAIGRNMGWSMPLMLRALGQYTGEPHRVQFVRALDGVDYFDDSKGTNVGATVAALQGLQRSCVLIAGGLGKGQDFAPLGQAARLHARVVVLIGQDAAQIAATLNANQVAHETVSDLPVAVARAQALAQAGDAVLLSPACASLDMFRDYEHRAQVFVQAVQQLQAKPAQPETPEASA